MNRALGADDDEEMADDDDDEEEARTMARERRKAAGTGGGERRDAAIGRARANVTVLRAWPRRSPVSGRGRLLPPGDRRAEPGNGGEFLRSCWIFFLSTDKMECGPGICPYQIS